MAQGGMDPPLRSMRGRSWAPGPRGHLSRPRGSHSPSAPAARTSQLPETNSRAGGVFPLTVACVSALSRGLSSVPGPGGAVLSAGSSGQSSALLHVRREGLAVF